MSPEKQNVTTHSSFYTFIVAVWSVGWHLVTKIWINKLLLLFYINSFILSVFPFPTLSLISTDLSIEILNQYTNKTVTETKYLLPKFFTGSNSCSICLSGVEYRWIGQWVIYKCVFQIIHTVFCVHCIT